MMRQPAALVVIWAIVLFDLLFLALPTLVIVVASFTAGNVIAFPPEGFSLRWYEVLLGERAFSAALWRSVQVAIVCTLVSIPAGTLAAIALARYRIRHATAIQIYLLLPFIVPLIVSGLGLMLIFSSAPCAGSASCGPSGSRPASSTCPS